jgi:hypothetical protein
VQLSTTKVWDVKIGKNAALLVIDVEGDPFQRAVPIHEGTTVLTHIKLPADRAHARHAGNSPQT